MANSNYPIFQQIVEGAEAMESELTAIRRDLHAHPELGWTENRTSSIIARKLTEYGCDEVLVGDLVCDLDSRMGLPSEEELEAHYRIAIGQNAAPEFLPYTRYGKTGVIGILHCGEGPVIAMRFDIDALPISENSSKEHFPAHEGFRSVNEGVMHACGHDGHTTIGLGTSKLLCSLRSQLHGTIKFIFQPAEEGVRGAKSIVRKGHLKDVNYLLAAHMAGNSTVTQEMIGIGDGSSLATTKMDVIYHGKAAHAGFEPETGNNAMLAMATAVLNLHAIPRFSKAGTRINVGKVTAGSGRNVICDMAKLELEVRGMTSEANTYMENYARQILKAAGEMHGCTCEIRLMGAAMCGANSPELCTRVYQVCTDKIHLPVIYEGPESSIGSEDFSYMSDEVIKHGGQSCYFHNINTLAGPLHNEHFNFQEKALVNGVKVFAGVAADLMID